MYVHCSKKGFDAPARARRYPGARLALQPRLPPPKVQVPFAPKTTETWTVDVPAGLGVTPRPNPSQLGAPELLFVASLLQRCQYRLGAAGLLLVAVIHQLSKRLGAHEFRPNRLCLLEDLSVALIRP